MSTQQATSIDFAITQDLTSFQLIELPDELLTIITNHKNNETPVLQLKSDAQTGNAVLCSSNKTFTLRSVQTSNSLFVVKPDVKAEYDDDEDAITTSGGMTAISKSGMTLELSKSTESAVSYLRKALPVYSSREVHASAAAKASYADICSNVPLSDDEVLDAWTWLCAFEAEGASFRPTAGVLFELWKALSTAATADSIDLSSAFLTEDLWISIRDEDYPKALFHALLTRIQDSNSMEQVQEANAISKWCSIDRQKCQELVAALVLEANTVKDQTMPVYDFFDKWKNSLPTSWASDSSTEIIDKIAMKSTSTTLSLKPDFRLAGPSASMASTTLSKGPAKAGKWHEKFKRRG